jgi:transglutaminase-like putative cysteine protease
MSDERKINVKKLNFAFSTKLTFDNYVHDHSFALRCTPIESPALRLMAYERVINPFCSVQNTADAFGNTVTSGFLKADHRFLDFEIKGTAVTDITQAKTDFMPCYKVQSGYTRPDENLSGFLNALRTECTAENEYDRTVFYAGKLSEIMTYEKGITDTKTTAAEAFEHKKGVCQDFTHIMLSLLRADGIPCRYMAGLASCDGETHSWLEIWCGGRWIGYDPTNNCPVTDDYLVLSQGRDFGDCAIDRGVMFGAYTRQMQLISSELIAV